MITVEQVAAHLRLSNVDSDRDALALAVDAVNFKVALWHGYAAGATWAADHTQGAIMLAAHLFRRRNSPGGVETFNELGTVYVQRSDPHVSMLLGLGAWTPPRIG